MSGITIRRRFAVAPSASLPSASCSFGLVGILPARWACGGPDRGAVGSSPPPAGGSGDGGGQAVVNVEYVDEAGNVEGAADLSCRGDQAQAGTDHACGLGKGEQRSDAGGADV